jgi:predicted Zn-dependent protease
MGRRQPQYLHRFRSFALAAILCFIGGIATQPYLEAEESLQLPSAQAHPLPQSLAQWNDPKTQGDYFDQVRTVKVGYLLWKNWPVKVYIAPPPQGTLIKPEVWHRAIAQAIQDWKPYLPLTVVETEPSSDIRISANPPKNRSGPRVRSAETGFELYVSDRQELAHRMSIFIRPNQTAQYITAAARHELGHALGIWGHSSTPTDVMYFSQVRTPPPISARDINTLKRIYQQPTQLGWPVVSSTSH